MITLGFLEEFLCESIEEYKTKVLKNKFFLDTFGTEENLDKIIYSVRDFLIKEFNKNIDEIERDFEILGKYHGKIGIPFETILHSLIFIKDSLYTKILESEKYLLLAPDLSTFFDKAINAHAKGYMLKNIDHHINDIRNIEKNHISPYGKIHLLWLTKFLMYVKGKEKLYPAIEVENCKFTSVIESFDFKIKFSQKDTLNIIKKLHKDLHMYAKSLIFYIKDREYVEAYFAYNNIINASFKLLDYLNNTYTYFFKNKKSIFVEHILKETKKKNMYLVVINVLNLGTINRFYGEEIGDKIIDIIDSKLAEIINYKNASFIKGYSGEFYILLEKPPEKMYQYAEYLKKEIEQITVRRENFDLKFGVSVSLIELSNIKNKKELMKIIDYSVEKSKSSLPKIFILKQEELKNVLKQEINKETSLIETLEKVFSKGNVELYFQPIYDLSENKIIAYEVLSRIYDGDKTIVAEDFINLIYNMKLIKSFDFEVLKKIVNKLPELKRLGKETKIFVNISPVSLSSSDFVKSLISTVEKAKKENIEIIVELTEQSLLENVEFLKFLKKDYKLTFAIDDFGTGYSSIKLVQDLSILGIIDFLKIDGNLIRDITNSNERRKLVELIVSFAKFHNLKTIGEFIEDKKTRDALKEIGVDYGQGFYFSKPKNIKELIRSLNEELTRTV